MKIITIFLLLTISAANAQVCSTGIPATCIPTPPRIVTWDFVAAHSVLAAARLSDTGLSAATLNGQTGCVEGNPLFRRNDGGFNTRKAVAVDAGIVGGITLIDYLARRSAPRSRLVRWFTVAIPLASSVRSWQAVANNARTCH